MKDIITPPTPPPRPKVNFVVDGTKGNGQFEGKVLVDNVEMATYRTNSESLACVLGEVAAHFYMSKLESHTTVVAESKGRTRWVCFK